ncbi:zinc ribbon domain-containing protein [Paenibacillus sepulcri]|uniref:Zinc ribbon domain-containing protein n=1 Tax=Paenibacillus sepulcri TaxID=359917 RepID=A0ABS7CBE0_9BACL|nr:zinc ribbon domain-containing protein [Paenibacillus sepulcri]
MKKGMFPLVSIMGGLATAVVLLFTAALVGGMLFLIRLMSDDSDKYKQMKEYMETVFGTPAHLRSGGDEPAAEEDETSTLASPLKPFSELCPACGEPVTHEHRDCPACGLRLL